MNRTPSLRARSASSRRAEHGNRAAAHGLFDKASAIGLGAFERGEQKSRSISRLSAASPLNSIAVSFTAAAVPTCPTLASDYGSIMEISRIHGGKTVVPPHAQERRDPGHDAPDRGSRRPAARGEAEACLGSLRLIDHDEHEILRL